MVMLMHRILRRVRNDFPLVAFWIYVAAFGTAFPFVFLFPQVTMLLFALCLASLPFAIITARVLVALHEWSCRHLLRSGRCPGCGGEDLADAVDAVHFCGDCGDRYRVNGERIHPRDESDETPDALSVAL